ncbi:YitT family protein [Bacillus sp. FJAT-47783]|uniref:YitT family protein n=1 Tax=Bacillus sp. FJAT-47783 TaxID=2922712 RepID=UPI001FAE6865|nr:YitT family protein [Bacillus sp. FJAT-47783]
MITHLRQHVFIIVGSLIFALGINYFAIPNKLSEGGVIGITVVLHYLFDWSPGLVNFILNGILMLVGYRYLDKKTMYYTLLCVIFSSGFLYLTKDFGNPIHVDTLLAALYAGIFVGIGLGLIFRAGGTSGGSSILAQMAKEYLGWSIAKGIFVFDLMVIGGSLFVIGQEKAMYTLVAVFVGVKVMDFILQGLDARKAVTIISDRPDLILKNINQNISRGVTVFKGYGGYSKNNKDVLYAVVNQQEVLAIRKLVNEIDPDAFVVIHDVRGAFGGGFKKESA